MHRQKDKREALISDADTRRRTRKRRMNSSCLGYGLETDSLGVVSFPLSGIERPVQTIRMQREKKRRKKKEESDELVQKKEKH